MYGTQAAAAQNFSQDSESEFRRLVAEGRYAYFNEEYEKAKTLLRAARELDPDNPETHEHLSLVILFELKKELGIEGDGTLNDVKRLKPYADNVTQFESEIRTGEELADAILDKHPEDQRALFVRERLRLNLIMFRRQIQDTLGGLLGEYRKAKPVIDQIVLRNPNDCRALVTQSRINYEIGSRPWYEKLGLRAIGVRGDKEMGIQGTAKAASMVCPDHFDSVEARFSFLSILAKEKKWHAASAMALELSLEFPKNTKIKYYLDLARSKTKIP
ncbi:MAG: hypothetical protein Q7S09_05955 [bacterium]|nr:hypothetical protein [bacterium]